MSNSLNSVKKVGSRLGEHFIGLESYLNDKEHCDGSDILVGKNALTTLTVLGFSTIISRILYPVPLKYVFGVTTISLMESFRFYINTLNKKYS